MARQHPTDETAGPRAAATGGRHTTSPGGAVVERVTFPQDGAPGGSGIRLKRQHRVGTPLGAAFAVAACVWALSGCGRNHPKTYDIAPIFPLSSDKCTKYDGTVDGSGITAHCWVSKANCEQAVTDWRHAMQQGGVADAIEFRCN